MEIGWGFVSYGGEVVNPRWNHEEWGWIDIGKVILGWFIYERQGFPEFYRMKFFSRNYPKSGVPEK